MNNELDKMAFGVASVMSRIGYALGDFGCRGVTPRDIRLHYQKPRGQENHVS